MARRRSGGRTRAAIFLLASLGAAVVFTFVVFKLIQRYQEQLDEFQQEEETRPVIVAAKELHQGQTIVAEDVVIAAVPPAFVPETTFQYVEDVVGRVPRERVLPGEFLREERLADPESGVGLNAIIPRGMRAVSINITDGSAVSGFLNPGNYVDVLVTLQGTDQLEKTVTLIQACYVLAVDDRMGGDGGRRGEGAVRPSVTLAVTPEAAQKLAHAHIKGDVTLTLRNDIDVTQVETHGATASKLIGVAGRTGIPMRDVRPPAPRPASAPAPRDALQIIRGSQVERKSFE
jgi:pilus assembly protein CpaB